MDLPTQLTFHDIERTEALEAYVRMRSEKLHTFHSSILACRVALEAPHRHQRHGNAYRVRIDISVPGRELCVNRAAQKDIDLYAAIDAAFDHAARVLKDHISKGHSRRASPAHARTMRVRPMA
jgi:ribosomal subunit interface protein